MPKTIAFEPWSDISPLPKLQLERADLYLRFPASASLERACTALTAAKYDVRRSNDPLVLYVPDLQPLQALRCVVESLTLPERVDTFALLRPCGTPIEPADQLLATNVEQLHDRLEAEWLLQLLRTENFDCVFQPIFRADDRTTVVGYEALLRGYRRGHEVSTARMFEVAKHARILGYLDALAMQIALAEAARCKLQGLLFVNCSPSHIYEPDLRMAELRSYCERAGLQPSQIVLEITETEDSDAGHLKVFIDAAREQHFRVALDDVGAGYASLGTLSELRPQIVKLDHRLITAIHTDAYRALILNRLLEAARILGVATVVEGIETEAELAWARENGATYVQGYLLGRPALQGRCTGSA